MSRGLFRRSVSGGVRPIEIGRALIREIDANRTIDMKSRRVVPNAFTVRLNPDDHGALADIESALVTELVEAAKEYAKDEGYHLRGPVSVTLEADPKVKAGRCKCESAMRDEGAQSIIATLVLPDERRLTLSDRTLVVGRLAECDIAFNDTNVSRRHAEIKPVKDGWAVLDLGSTNGTKVNGTDITFERVLRDGDIVTFGSHSVRYEAQ